MERPLFAAQGNMEYGEHTKAYVTKQQGLKSQVRASFFYLFYTLEDNCMPKRVELPYEELHNRYLQGESTIALARRYRCSPTTIAKALRSHGTEVRPARFHTVVVPEGALRDMYCKQRLEIGQIAAYFGVAPSTIGNKRRAYGIAVRPRRL